MPQEDKPDFGFLYDASATLLGYFVRTWYAHYLTVILANVSRWHEQGLIENLFEPTERGAQSMPFDFAALNLEKVVYINGIYFYILACHKGANYRLMHRFEGKQVLYLRGFDFEGSVATGGEMAMGFSSVDSERFNLTLGERLGPHFALFKVFSPKDVYWETIAAQRMFYRDFGEMTKMAQYPFLSVYVNALRWKTDVEHLIDRMDHFVVYVASMTESALWELEQLDTDERRGRVTVVFDEKAIANKELQLDVQEKMRQQFGEKLVWSKQGAPPFQTAAELRAHLSQRFLVTTPEDFKSNIDEHRKRIAASSSTLAPGLRETWIDFRFYPALDAPKLEEITNFSAAVQDYVSACVAEQKITWLPLFLNNVQLRIFLTLLMGEHHETGLALAAYGGVMHAALNICPESGKKLNEIRTHHEMAEHIATHMLSFGKSHEFDNLSAKATADYQQAFDAARMAAASFFATASLPSL